MASNDICESCFGKGQSVAAEKLCTDCEERLCHECGKNHLGFKAFKFHHLIELTSIPSNLSSFPKYCSVHEDMILDFYCTHHSTTCCRMCIPKTHQSCSDVIPLEEASKDVEKSTLYEETITQLKNIILTLPTLFQDRESNLKKIRHTASSIKIQITAYKQRLIRQIDDLKGQLIQSLNSIQSNVDAELNKTKHNITEQMTKTKQIMEELEFFRTHGTTNQLFLVLHKHNQGINSLEVEITEIISRCKVTDIIFKQPRLDLSNLVTITEQSGPCNIQYRPSKVKQAQEKSVIPSKHLTEFIGDGEIQLPKGDDLNITDITATFDDNYKLLLCNFNSICPKVFLYTDCKTFENELTFSSSPYGIAVIPDTSKAVITLPLEDSIQFINTVTITKEDKISLEFPTWCVAVSANKIFIGGGDKVRVLDTKGTPQKKIVIPNTDNIYYLNLNNGNTELVCRNAGTLCWTDLDGNILYQYNVSGVSGIAVDRQGDVYVGDYRKHQVHRLSSKGKLKEVKLTSKDGIGNPRAL